MSDQSYDVVIMGAGFAGLCQARHLMLNVPGIRVVMIDRRCPDSDERDLKVGESTVEISAMFLYKELGLYDYMIDNHPPKYGLNFHWPKDGAKTDELEDYHHVWTNRQPNMASFQINRGRLERDLLRMNLDQGVDYLHGKVTDFTLAEGDERHTVEVKTAEGAMKTLSATHLIDAAGRKFLIGKKTDNLITDSEELCGLRTGSVWLRVRDVDRTLFQDGYDPLSGTGSRYYGTNHFLGKAHWMWMIPIERETQTVSFGVVHHLSEIEVKSVNTKEKFLNFVGANHNVVKRLIDSGEIVDFKCLPRVPHVSKRMLSNDNWYAIGDAASMIDPFYSVGLVIASVNITGVTEVIRAKMAGEADAAQKCDEIDAFNVAFVKVFNQIYRDHDKHLGNASVMSWRIYLENMNWFGMLVPMFVGKWHLDPDFNRKFLKLVPFMFGGENSIFQCFYREFTYLAEKGRNVGMMDYIRGDQLCLGYAPTGSGDFFLENAVYEPQRINVFKGMRTTMFFMALLFLKLKWKGRGLMGLLSPGTWWVVAKLLGLSAFTGLGAIGHWFKNLGQPCNSANRDANLEFDATYVREADLQKW